MLEDQEPCFVHKAQVSYLFLCNRFYFNLNNSYYKFRDGGVVNPEYWLTQFASWQILNNYKAIGELWIVGLFSSWYFSFIYLSITRKFVFLVHGMKLSSMSDRSKCYSILYVEWNRVGVQMYESIEFWKRKSSWWKGFGIRLSGETWQTFKISQYLITHLQPVEHRRTCLAY